MTKFSARLSITKLILNCFDDCDGVIGIIGRIFCRLLLFTITLSITATILGVLIVQVAKSIKGIL